MLPTLFSIGAWHISSFGVLSSIAFIIFSFLVWRSAHDKGFIDEKIFDNLVVVTVAAFAGARFVFAISHPQLFIENWLRVFVIWRFPGLSFWGALSFALAAFYFYTRKQKLPRAAMFDCYAQGLPPLMFFISLAIFLDGTLIGKETNWFTAMPAPGVSGNRHPLGLYLAQVALILWLFSYLFSLKRRSSSYPKGILGWATLSVIGLTQLVLALFRVDLLYLHGFSLEQVLGLGLLIGSLVALLMVLGGVKLLKKTVHPSKI